jgi:hypothetical protein
MRLQQAQDEAFDEHTNEVLISSLLKDVSREGGVLSSLLPVIAGLDPAIQSRRPWIAGSSPAMTERENLLAMRTFRQNHPSTSSG